MRTNFAAHLVSKPFARLARHPRMIEPVQDLLGEALYMHWFKINGKMAFEGDVWQWRQDYGTRLNDDMMPTERAMNIAIFLDDVNEYNAPQMSIPGSHRRGVVEAHRDFTPISCLPDDCLLQDYPVQRPWKDGPPASAMQTSSVPLDETRRAA